MIKLKIISCIFSLFKDRVVRCNYVTIRDLRSFEIRIRIGRPIRFDSKGIGRFDSEIFESSQPCLLLCWL